MKKQSFLFVFLAVLVLALAACSPKTAEPVAVEAAAAADSLIAEGRLLPVNALDQSFALPGQVVEVLVKDGDTVTVGQVLARLDASPEASLVLARAQQELLAAQQALDLLDTTAPLNLAQAELAVVSAQEQLDAAQERFDDDDTDENRAALDVAGELLAQAEDNLAKLKAGAGIDPDQQAAAEMRLASANAALAAAQAALDARELRATLAGTLVDVTLQPGQRVTAGQPVLTVADFSGWVIETDNLTEMEVTNVQIGQQVEIILDALPDVTFQGEVTKINARYEEKRGDITYTVTLALTQTDPRLRWGMTSAVYFQP